MIDNNRAVLIRARAAIKAPAKFDRAVRRAVRVLNRLHPEWSHDKCMTTVRQVPPKHLKRFIHKVTIKLSQRVTTGAPHV